MQIELFGCTSAGKSSLAVRLVESARADGVEAFLSEDFVLRQLRLEGLRLRWLRRLCVDLLAVAACAAAWRRQGHFLRFALRSLADLPREVSWPQRLNIARNVLKKTGVREIVQRRAAASELVVMDEGTLQIAHYLFVHVCCEPDAVRLAGFLERVPLPDVAVFVRESHETLIRRTVARGHARIPDRAARSAALFTRRAVETLGRVALDPRVTPRLLVVDRPVPAVSDAPSGAASGLQRVRRLLCAAAPPPAAAGASFA